MLFAVTLFYLRVAQVKMLSKVSSKILQIFASILKLGSQILFSQALTVRLSTPNNSPNSCCVKPLLSLNCFKFSAKRILFILYL